ncbi:methyltransferase [Mycobacterium shigaense]|uniref:Hydroxyneurosporene-O-methyltransferase n=1 Tax=Mycobacterium shigaense TaxID=722731 RepID=A0A1Z4EF69_9MYCO|nr:methyltransferase [Mycobacterium shigaense]MEA1122157.1 methyltransferase [Mycobacterium shigaense]PRI16346.1 hydroxyneurosporene methyltransferase [Mycobacterium shigaense]BAX91602.1 hydroxyneurosporene-O-methyltransferase [Mycobacterium shigaense]
MASKVPPAKVARAVERARYHLSRLRQRSAPPAAVVMELILNAWVAQAITTAADLRLAEALADGPLSGEDLARRVGADADALRRLLRALIGIGIFRQRRDGRYALTPLAETLRTDAPVSMAGMARWVGSQQHREHWSHLTDAIRTGHPVVPGLRGKPIFEYLADEGELGETFNSAMTNLSEFAIVPLTAAYDFSAFGTIVDVGGGHGRLLAAILEAAPNSRGVLFDLPEVVAGAPELFRKYGVDDRIRIEEGSFFDSVPEGGDAYVLKSVIHDWPGEDAVRILTNVRTAARAGARLLLCEFVIPEHDRDFHGKWVDLEMLVVAGARERTSDEYGRLFEQAGFRLTRVVDTVSPLSIVEATAV